ncbi:hypothetical protein BHU24_25140 [Bacillus pseudomycoides]|uniref:hypothetical protein n=1 Tax=Bacillus pseudomycoides TaxID=64104 RepID=UPI000BED7B6A|nr:hypothetical protein [Bacillus pseudomycoides]MBD5799860.1 hypothetical protein [Bacillus pseudomycoides]MED1476518.1 hypothetical protein [Bacillus pseudomycoides]PDZ13437.1 hypothetical protein CON70_01580 [Bacillus pseudomycoides]PEO83569.1 hypothetical protein CN571_24750 [Bacillus pseudomycoides]
MTNNSTQKLILDIKKSFEEDLYEKIKQIKEEDLLLGWEAHTIDIQGIPEPPDKYVYLIGAYYKEWFIKECDSKHIYLVPKENFVGNFNNNCYNEQIKIYRKSDKVKEWVAGFNILSEYCVDGIRITEKKKLANNNKQYESPVVLNSESNTKEHLASEIIYASLSEAYDLYEGKCDCGDRYDNNCAHFLSNALIKAGFRMPSSGAKCRSGRMIRAKELRQWVRSIPGVILKADHNSISSGYWFVYQERASDGQGHVCIHLESPEEYYWAGTGNYPDWELQEHYKF